MKADSTYVFLDFDGVTHPWGEVEDFRCLPLIEEVVRQYEQIRIVITSDWRTLFSPQKLASRFSADIRPRIAGVTPHLVPKRGAELHGLREREARQWLEQRNESGSRWLALDDAPGNWLTRARLILTDFKQGFSEEDAQAMIRLVERLHGGDAGVEEQPLRAALWG